MEKLRFLISTARGGSSALINGITQSPEVGTCFFQNVKSGIRETGKPDYSIFEGNKLNDPENLIRLAKETIGHSVRKECDFKVFPNKETLEQSIPLFLFRDPIETFNSWQKFGWGDIDLFETAYKNLYETFLIATQSSNKVQVVLQQDLFSSPEKTFRKICDFWEINFTPLMLNWERGFAENPKMKFGADIEHYKDTEALVGANGSSFKKTQTGQHLTQLTIDAITSRLGNLWLDVQERSKE